VRHGPAKRKRRPGGKQSNLPHRQTPLSEPRPSDIDAAVGHRRQAAAMLRGHVAEWLRSGLQNRLPRFNSGRGLHQQNQQLRTGFERLIFEAVLRLGTRWGPIECRALPQPWPCIHFSAWASKHRYAITPQPGSDGVEPNALDTPDRHRGLVQAPGDLVALITDRSEPRDRLHHTHHQRPCVGSLRLGNRTREAHRRHSAAIRTPPAPASAWARPAGGIARDD
jgi:hypothetical protein